MGESGDDKVKISYYYFLLEVRILKRILVTGATGQIGSELIVALKERYGKENVISTMHVRKPPEDLEELGPWVTLDVTDRNAVDKVIEEYDIDTIYHLAAILSATGEKNPQLAFRVNLLGTYNILEAGVKYNLERVMIPSSIAVFGPETPRDNTPNETVLKPTTMYGITKVAGELLGNYYFKKYGLDVRGLRFPGLISWKTPPGGGTTDYAVEIFYYAVEGKKYTCFLREDTYLPMMYMPDAIRALIELAEAPIEKLKHHADFNITAMSFSPRELVEEIRKYIPDFEVEYKPDYRQEIADSWPNSIDDSAAREEWGWRPEYDLPAMVDDMIKNIARKLGKDLP